MIIPRLGQNGGQIFLKTVNVPIKARTYNSTNNFSKPIAKKELDAAIQKILIVKYPDDDLILEEMVKDLGKNVKDYLLDIINMMEGKTT
ncbi:hypothetical protein TNCV_4690071 [Trichonephila clavipes]|nr:hypothetical protein TNCV_4690071 [Trichonephila clavipes]